MPTATVMTFEGGLIEFQVDYDASNRLTAVRCINQTDHDVWARVARPDNGRAYEHTFPANTTQEFAIPIGQAQRIQFDSIGVHGQFTPLQMKFRT